jgi:hypothetical protein
MTYYRCAHLLGVGSNVLGEYFYHLGKITPAEVVSEQFGLALKRTDRNQMIAKIYGGNFEDLDTDRIPAKAAESFFRDMAAHHPVIRVFLKFVATIRYLIQRRGENEDTDYQVRINDFWNLMQKARSSTKQDFRDYIVEHPFERVHFHSNTYFHLRTELHEVVRAVSDEDFSKAVTLYRQYLSFHSSQLAPTIESEVFAKLLQQKKTPYEAPVSRSSTMLFPRARRNPAPACEMAALTNDGQQQHDFRL